MSVSGIVVAAGRGERFGGAKAGALLSGRALWEWGRDALLAGGVRTVVVVGDVPGAIPGGERRRDSVFEGLSAIPDDSEHVLVHDAARPLASPRLVASVLARLLDGGADGVVPGIAVRDALKRVDGDRVVETVTRRDVVSVQTPQGFVVDSLLRAHRGSDEDATDDAELVERAGGTIVVIPGEGRNLKITYPGDLALAEGLLP